jgi:hypothetical protein
MLRICWVAIVVAAVPALDSSLSGRPDAVGDVARAVAGGLWLIGVGAMAIPAVTSLTATRAIVPFAIPVSVASAFGGARVGEAAAFVAIAGLATVIALTAELGRSFVQASAYGDEQRFPLRPPLAYLVASVLTWLVWCATVMVGPLSLADRRWVLGGLVTVAALAIPLWAWPRWHKLSRRWFVLVPTGVVVHDHVVLGETLMIRRQELAAVRLAPADTDALDLTGPAPGHAVEVVTVAPATLILAATPSARRGQAIHFTACLVAPTRPGQMLAAAGERRMPVG